MSIKGYVYTMFTSADPGEGWEMTDPIFGKGKVPTMGACRPDIRRAVERGDRIFVVSGRVSGVQQYVVGGFAVGEKINQLIAYNRFPENRQHLDANGNRLGNVIVLPDGTQNPIDYHDISRVASITTLSVKTPSSSRPRRKCVVAGPTL